MGGIAAAVALARAGVEVRVYEQAQTAPRSARDVRWRQTACGCWSGSGLAGIGRMGARVRVVSGSETIRRAGRAA